MTDEELIALRTRMEAFTTFVETGVYEDVTYTGTSYDDKMRELLAQFSRDVTAFLPVFSRAFNLPDDSVPSVKRHGER